jgi:soluble lytic murein transglycosylase
MYSARVRRARYAAFALAAIALGTSCAKREAPAPSAPPPPSASATAAASGDDGGGREGGAAAAGDDDAGARLPWAESIRQEKWDDAWRALEALGDADKTVPEVRYARGRVALARGDAAAAAKLLDGLESLLPLLTEDIARYRADARLAAGPFDAAGEYFAGRPSPAAQLKAARAFVKAKDVRARTAADRVILHDKRTRAQEAEARALRAGLGGPDAGVAADARWIRVHAPDTSFDHDAEATLAKTDPTHPLTAEEWMTRARALADAGRANDALAAIDRAAAAPGRVPAGVDRMRAKADALFKAKNRYGEAWSVFTQTAQLGGPHATEDAFMAARSLARADRDDEAIRDYEALERRYPRTTWADQAAFHAARLHFLHARWRDAAAGFDGYLKRYPGGSERKDATRSLAVSRLMLGDHKTARRLFGQIADDEEGLGGTRAANMEALAAAKEGDRTHAVARWTEVARARPLSWPALVARARLIEAGAPIPPTVEADDAQPAGPPLAVKLPPPVDMLHRIGLDDDAEDALAAREAAVTQGAAGRGTEALCAAYGQLGRARRRYQIALQIPAAMLTRGPSPRTRWAWECAYPTPYEGVVRASEEAGQLPEGLVFSVMRQESNFDPDAVSAARAVGLMQLLPETARAVADDMKLAHDDARLTSPAQNITLGGRYLRDLLDRFHGAIPLAVGGYNGGPDTIARWASRAPTMETDVFVEFIPFTETRIYVGRVLGNLARYGYLRHGEAGVPKLKLTPG